MWQGVMNGLRRRWPTQQQQMYGASEGAREGGVCSCDGRWIDAHWEGGGGGEDAMIYSLNSPTRSSCLFADPQQRTRKALKSPLIFSSLKYERKSSTVHFTDGSSLRYSRCSTREFLWNSFSFPVTATQVFWKWRPTEKRHGETVMPERFWFLK